MATVPMPHVVIRDKKSFEERAKRSEAKIASNFSKHKINAKSQRELISKQSVMVVISPAKDNGRNPN